MMPLFITFEGCEGCGKSVQSKVLFRRLCREDHPAVLTYEPGGTPLGESICRWLKWRGEIAISAMSEIFLFNASRRQLMDTVIKPSLEQGMVVICDRFTDSTLAYQGYGRGLGLEMINHLNFLATDGIKPDLTILLDMPVVEGLARKGKTQPDRFEKQPLEFHEKVRRGYLQMARNEPERWLIINAGLSKREITAIIWNKVSSLLASREA